MKKFDPLKWLCLLSFIGFIFCFTVDLGYFLAFFDVNFEEISSNNFISLIHDNLKNNGFELSHLILIQLKKLYMLRIIFDILAMVGVGFMFFKLKIGWTFYWVFQISYFISPYIFLNFDFQTSWPYLSGIALIMFPLFNNMVHLIYVLLFMSQKKQFK